MLSDLPVVIETFARVVRLVNTARLQESPLLKLVGGTDVDELSEIASGTSQRHVAEARGTARLSAKDLVYGVPSADFINAAFANAKPREPNRFNGPDRGAWYAALAVGTSLAEVIFHRTEFLARTRVFEGEVYFSELLASLAGEFLDLRQNPDHAALHPDKTIGYPAGNALASAVIDKGYNGIIYPSVRDSGGTCVVALFPHAVQSVTEGGTWKVIWTGKPNPQVDQMIEI